MLPGNLISYGSDYFASEQTVATMDGRRVAVVRGVGIITATPQTSIPVNIYPDFNREMRGAFPVIPLTIPSGAQVLSASLRLPRTTPAGSAFVWGQDLPRGTGMLGTATDVVKLGYSSQTPGFAFLNANTASLVCAAGNRYVPNAGNRISRTFTTADSSTDIRNTLGSALSLMIFVTNNSSTAAGTGISLTGATSTAPVDSTALIAAEIVYAITDEPVLHDAIPNLGRISLFL